MRPIDILEDIFTNQISVLNISVPTYAANANEARKICLENNYDVYLVRDSFQGNLQLYERSTDIVRNLVDHEVISESTPILDVIELLIEYPQIFIKEKRNVTRIVSRADLDSIPLRIWLFGMISIMEVELRNRIKSTIFEWTLYLTPGRLDYANKLFQEKLGRNEEADLLDCLQIVDLSSIIRNKWDVFQSQFEFSNSKSFINNLKALNKLRDELAHAQRLTLEWEEIYNLMAFVRMCLAAETKVEEV